MRAAQAELCVLCCIVSCPQVLPSGISVSQCHCETDCCKYAFRGFPARRHVYRPVRQVRPDPSATTRPAGEGSAFDGRPMEECLRSACPCLEALWRRIFGEKRGPPGGVEPPQPPPPSPDTGSLYMALWGFESCLPDVLSFRQGDLFAVLTRDGDWWSVQRIDPGGRVLDTGIVPGNYLARADSLESQT